MSMNAEVDHIFIRGDSLHIRRLFINMIDNALKYTDKNGRIGIHATLMNGKAVVTVSDTGVGIAPEDLPKIFDRFYRASNIWKQGTRGTGLGLSIVKSIVDDGPPRRGG